MGKEKENSFESNMQKLENIVDRLESGEIGLEESVKLYEEGMKIKKICDKKLKDINKIEWNEFGLNRLNGRGGEIRTPDILLPKQEI